MQKCSLSRSPVTLIQGQGHLEWYQNVEVRSTYHQIKFEPNQFIKVGMRANIKVFNTVDRASNVARPGVLNDLEDAVKKNH